MNHGADLSSEAERVCFELAGTRARTAIHQRRFSAQVRAEVSSWAGSVSSHQHGCTKIGQEIRGSRMSASMGVTMCLSGFALVTAPLDAHKGYDHRQERPYLSFDDGDQTPGVRIGIIGKRVRPLVHACRLPAAV